MCAGRESLAIDRLDCVQVIALTMSAAAQRAHCDQSHVSLGVFVHPLCSVESPGACLAQATSRAGVWRDQEATTMQRCRRFVWSVLAMPLMAAGCEGAEELEDTVGVSTQALSRPRTPNVPAELRVPEGNVLSFVADAEGVQVYACAAGVNGAAPAWTFERPDALLFGRWGRVIGHHYEGPSWEGLDDSLVTASDPKRFSVDGAIPWLRLTATGFGGDGMFSRVRYIQRLNTEGGLAPTDGCEADHIGARVRIAYTATYYFYTAANSGRPWRP